MSRSGFRCGRRGSGCVRVRRDRRDGLRLSDDGCLRRRRQNRRAGGYRHWLSRTFDGQNESWPLHLLLRIFFELVHIGRRLLRLETTQRLAIFADMILLAASSDNASWGSSLSATSTFRVVHMISNFGTYKTKKNKIEKVRIPLREQIFDDTG